MIKLTLLGVLAGVVGTVVMDIMNDLLARSGLLVKINIRMIGRMSAGWLRGRFSYGDPAEMEPSANELLLGFITHYAISVIFALVYVFGWQFLVGGTVSAVWALVFGIATTVASQFLVFPSMGLGVCGHRAPEGARASLSSLVNHTFFGAGMAIAIKLV